MIRAWMEEPRLRFPSPPQTERRELKCVWSRTDFEVVRNGFLKVGAFMVKGIFRESSHEGT